MTQRMPPGLYVVATPIGNLEDLSPRAAMVLREAAIVAAEDTRTSKTILRQAGSEARLVSLTEHNVDERTPGLLAAASTGIVALVSDAGTPVIADPGARLVAAAHTAQAPVFAIAGPSALSAAVSVSGFEGSDVHFLGFLPKQRGERLARLQAAAKSASVLVFFESPGRLSSVLNEVAETFSDPEIVVCRELTKLHEENVRGRASVLAGRFAGTRGECTVVVRIPEPVSGDNVAEAAAFMAMMRSAGARRSAAAAETARRFNVHRDTAYSFWDGAEGG